MYAIYARYYYYAGTYGAKKDGQLWDGDAPLKFDTKQDAIDWLCFYSAEEKGRDINKCVGYSDKNGHIRYTQQGRYYLAHAEYEKPDYKITKLRG